MRSGVLRGMPYGTVEYGSGVLPVIASEIVAAPPIVDGATKLECGTLLDPTVDDTDGVLVQNEVELYFPMSDFTWLVFFSRPVLVECFINPDKVAAAAVSLPPGAVGPEEEKDKNAFQLRVVDSSMDSDGDDNEEPLLVRMALANNCTLGTNVHFCTDRRPQDQSAFASVLREHSGVYPTSPEVKYAFSNPEQGKPKEGKGGEYSRSAYLFFDWGAKMFGGRGSNNESGGIRSINSNDNGGDGSEGNKELITFALPHHVDILRPLDGRSSNANVGHCVHSLHGEACLVKGNLWAMEEELGGLPNFMAPRPPGHSAIPALAEALSNDISYSLPENYMYGAGDTYFGGKMLAKLGRIIVVAQELRALAERPDDDVPDITTHDGKELQKIVRACKNADLPTETDVTDAIARLRRGVEVWLDGSSASPHTYDTAWGGLVNCGCLYDGDRGCDNSFPNCPAYSDPGLNFGNGYYNDHHFHYGYHIYAAAIVARYDMEWGRKYFERVLLMIRDIANPSEGDAYFPTFRQKDWFLGNSWASGIALIGGRPYMNGRNQESSSEAIAAYEGIAMYGSVMMKAFGNGKGSPSDVENAHASLRIFNVGRFLASTEIRSADRYWHVYSPKRDVIYPDSYTPNVVSMMWDTMCQFQTWFGNAPYLAYGIQLLPLTPISERRDRSLGDQWIRQLYPSFADSCDSNQACVDEGWAVLLYAVLAELGHVDLAMEKALALPDSVFESAGGSGHSLTNTLWYIGSRPKPSVPYDLEDPSTSIHSKPVPDAVQAKAVDCGCPETCDAAALGSDANGKSCKERIQWLVANRGLGELGACRQVAGNEYPDECGACDPELCAEHGAADALSDKNVDEGGQPKPVPGCPPCDAEVCNSEYNRCQISTAPFLCYDGGATGGCSSTPWPTDLCSACCELFQGCEG